MREELKMAKALEKLAALGVNTGIAKQDVRAVSREARVAKPDPIYTAEAVLMFLQQPARFMFKNCKREECGEQFGTNYRSVAYCSDNCRIKKLKAIGILWDPSKKLEERWGGEPPLLISPEALRVLVSLSQAQQVYVEPVSSLQGDLLEPQIAAGLVYKDPPIAQVNDFDTTVSSSKPLESKPVFDFQEVGAFEL